MCDQRAPCHYTREALLTRQVSEVTLKRLGDELCRFLLDLLYDTSSTSFLKLK